MPLIAPPAVVEHPADLVIDVFGTFLGKRSERMVVRWREGKEPAPPSAVEPEFVRFPAPNEAAVDEKVSGTLGSVPDTAAQGLLDLWGDETCATSIRISPAARLREKLDQIADEAGDDSPL